MLLRGMIGAARAMHSHCTCTARACPCRIGKSKAPAAPWRGAFPLHTRGVEGVHALSTIVRVQSQREKGARALALYRVWGVRVHVQVGQGRAAVVGK